MDALELLKLDHQRVRDLFEEARTSDSDKKKRVIFSSIKNELDTHTHVEETIFYPAFRNFPEFGSLLDDAYKEHQQVKDLLRDIEAMSDGSGSLQSRLDELSKLVEDHVGEEERKFFQQVKQVMKPAEREQLGRHIQAAKNERFEAA